MPLRKSMGVSFFGSFLGQARNEQKVVRKSRGAPFFSYLSWVNKKGKKDWLIR